MPFDASGVIQGIGLTTLPAGKVAEAIEMRVTAKTATDGPPDLAPLAEAVQTTGITLDTVTGHSSQATEDG